jgi:hypothetical protein
LGVCRNPRPGPARCAAGRIPKAIAIALDDVNVAG